MADACPGEKFREGVTLPSTCETIKEEVIRKKISDFLLTKGFLPEDLEEDVPYRLETDQENFQLAVSFIIRLKDRLAVMIKCGAGSIMARERAALALARLCADYQIPITIVTNGEDAVVLDTLTGDNLGSGLSAIPDKADLLTRITDLNYLPLPEKRKPLEKRILAAFEGLGLHGECH
jgi:hypothetical protein